MRCKLNFNSLCSQRSTKRRRFSRDLEALLNFYRLFKGRADERPVLKPICRLASASEVRSAEFETFNDVLKQLAQRYGLRTEYWSKNWEYPWLWFNCLSKLCLNGLRVLDIGSELSPMPWFLSSLGAYVFIVETNKYLFHDYERIKAQTGYSSVSWKIADNETLPFEDSFFDVVTSFSVLEHQRHTNRPKKRL
ncbi:biotin synthase [Candidatus Magnetoovum chiemensis]|nr:biotin synthase [Candidatus Magnetoovum chiemensis]